MLSAIITLVYPLLLAFVSFSSLPLWCLSAMTFLYLQGSSRVQAHWLSVSSVPFHLLDLRLRRLALGVSNNALLALGYHLCSSPQIDLTSAPSVSRVARSFFSFLASRRFPLFRLFHAWWLICHGLFLTNIVFLVHPFQIFIVPLRCPGLCLSFEL